MALPNAQPLKRLRFHEKRESAAAQAKNWRDLKAAVTKRDGPGCFIDECKKVGFDLHHLLRRSLGGKDVLHNVVRLCRDHHAAVHGHALTFRWTDDANRATTCAYEWAREIAVGRREQDR